MTPVPAAPTAAARRRRSGRREPGSAPVRPDVNVGPSRCAAKPGKPGSRESRPAESGSHRTSHAQLHNAPAGGSTGLPSLARRASVRHAVANIAVAMRSPRQVGLRTHRERQDSRPRSGTPPGNDAHHDPQPALQHQQESSQQALVQNSRKQPGELTGSRGLPAEYRVADCRCLPPTEHV